MDYSLAKKLKDAGFLQKLKTGSGFYYSGKICYMGDCDDGLHTIGCGCCGGSFKGDLIKVPSLSELIEACGGEAFRLSRNSEGRWFSSYGLLLKWEPGEGATPEEAVATLWLNLNAKAK